MKAKVDVPFRGSTEITIEATAKEVLQLFSGESASLILKISGRRVTTASKAFVKISTSEDELRTLRLMIRGGR